MNSELIVKLMRLAYNEGAEEGEAIAAFLKGRQILFKNHCGFEELTAALSGEWTSSQSQPQPEASCCDYERTRMTFGQYRNTSLSIGDIARTNPQYLNWVLNNVSNLRPDQRRMITEALRSVNGSYA